MKAPEKKKNRPRGAVYCRRQQEEGRAENNQLLGGQWRAMEVNDAAETLDVVFRCRRTLVEVRHAAARCARCARRLSGHACTCHHHLWDLVVAAAAAAAAAAAVVVAVVVVVVGGGGGGGGGGVLVFFLLLLLLPCLLLLFFFFFPSSCSSCPFLLLLLLVLVLVLVLVLLLFLSFVRSLPLAYLPPSLMQPPSSSRWFSFSAQQMCKDRGFDVSALEPTLTLAGFRQAFGDMPDRKTLGFTVHHTNDGLFVWRGRTEKKKEEEEEKKKKKKNEEEEEKKKKKKKKKKNQEK